MGLFDPVETAAEEDDFPSVCPSNDLSGELRIDNVSADVVDLRGVGPIGRDLASRDSWLEDSGRGASTFGKGATILSTLSSKFASRAVSSETSSSDEQEESLSCPAAIR